VGLSIIGRVGISMQVKSKALGLVLLLLISMLVPSYRASATVPVYWHVKGRDSFVAPILIRKSYYLFDHLGHLVSGEEERCYVLGVGQVVRK